MGFFPILVGLAALFFMWFALVAQSLRTKSQVTMRAWEMLSYRENQVLETLEQVLVLLRAEFGVDHEMLTDLTILKNQSPNDKTTWFGEISQELEKILIKIPTQDQVGKNIEHLLTNLAKYKHNAAQYQRAMHYYNTTLQAGAVRIPARILGYEVWK